MHPTARLIRFVLPLACAALLSACAGSGATWSFAPLGPTAAPSPSGGPTAAPTAGPSGSGVAPLVVEVATLPDNAQAFTPNSLDAPANTVVQVNYLNDTVLEHNINFFDGPDSSGTSLGATISRTGPDDSQSTTFTTPATPGDYYFWCDLHGASMIGTLHVTQ